MASKTKTTTKAGSTKGTKKAAAPKVPDGGSASTIDDSVPETKQPPKPVPPATVDAAPPVKLPEWKFEPVPIGPSPWDKLDPTAIPAEEHFDWQPKELVGVIGSHARRTWDTLAMAPLSRKASATFGDEPFREPPQPLDSPSTFDSHENPEVVQHASRFSVSLSFRGESLPTLVMYTP